MKQIGKFNSAMRDFRTNKILVTFAFEKLNLESLNELQDKDLEINIKKWSPKKSDRANRYFWELIGQLAPNIKS